MEALGRFRTIFKQMRPVMSQQEWFYHRVNGLVHTATAVVLDWVHPADRAPALLTGSGTH